MKEWPNAAIVVIFVAVLLAISGCRRASQQTEMVDGPQSQDTSGPRRGTLHDLGDGMWVWRGTPDGTPHKDTGAVREVLIEDRE